jgi:hypothetical protein
LIAALEHVLRYENDEVVWRFAADHGVSRADAAEVFLETKRWLWLCASEMDGSKDGVGVPIPLLSEARVLDLMWHTFVIFTKDYAGFCQRYFGFFVHHQPRLQVEKDAWERKVREDAPAALAERRAMLRGAYETICDRLGPATLRKWCEDFPARFGP